MEGCLRRSGPKGPKGGGFGTLRSAIRSLPPAVLYEQADPEVLFNSNGVPVCPKASGIGISSYRELGSSFIANALPFNGPRHILKT